VLGSPYNLSRDERGLCLFDTPFSIMLRHYKTDWWGSASRMGRQRDPDKEPLTEPLQAALESAVAGSAPWSTRSGRLAQNKRAMAFMWEHIHRFLAPRHRVIPASHPRDLAPGDLHHEQLLAQRRNGC